LWLLVYYQVSGEPGIARCSHRSDIYLRECGLARKLIHWSSQRNLFFACLIFAVGLDREIILTAKFSRSTVVQSPFLCVLLSCCMLLPAKPSCYNWWPSKLLIWSQHSEFSNILNNCTLYCTPIHSYVVCRLADYVYAFNSLHMEMVCTLPFTERKLILSVWGQSGKHCQGALGSAKGL